MIAAKVPAAALWFIVIVMIVLYSLVAGSLIYIGTVTEHWWAALCGAVLVAIPGAWWISDRSKE